MDARDGQSDNCILECAPQAQRFASKGQLPRFQSLLKFL
jgi:hypothetical protein